MKLFTIQGGKKDFPTDLLYLRYLHKMMIFYFAFISNTFSVEKVILKQSRYLSILTGNINQLLVAGIT